MKIKLSPKFAFYLYAILIFITLSSFRNRGVESTGFDIQILIKVIVWSFCGLMGFVYWKALGYKNKCNYQLLIIMFSLYIFATSPFSPAGLYSVVTSFVFVCCAVFYIYLFTVLDKEHVLKAFVIGTSSLVFLSLMATVVSPDLVYQEYWNDLGYIEGVRFKGLTTNANSLGQLAAVSLFIVIVMGKSIFRKKSITRGLLIFTLFCILIFSQSRTSLLALLLALSYVFFYRRFAFFYTATYFTFCFITVIYFTELYKYLLPSLSRSGSVEELFTFTGRTLIWEVVWELIKESPYFGYGYASSKVIIPLNFETSWGWTTVNSHSFMLQLLLSTGFIGSLPIFLLISFQFYRLLTFKGRLSSALFVFVLVTGILESGAIGPIPNFMTLVWLLSIFLIYYEKT